MVLGDGNAFPDWQVLDEHNILLRAERAAAGTGREYYIFVICQDDSWNFNFQQVIVTVPHDMKASGYKIGRNRSAADILSATIWPNPGTQYFNLEVETSSAESIEVYISDVNGRLISILTNVNRDSYRFGDDLKPGIYFATIRQGSNFTTIKVVKQ